MTPFSPKIDEPKSTVVSMIHIPLTEEKPGLIPNVFRIPAGSPEKPSVTHISAAKHHVYLDDTRGSLPVRDASYEVARSIVEDYITAQPYISEGIYPGLFWVPGALSLEDIKEEFPELLTAAHIAHKRWTEKHLKAADDDYARYQKHNVVSDFQRALAKMNNLDPRKHPWMNISDTMAQLSCPGCGNMTIPGVAMCGICKTVLNQEKYDQLTFAK